MIVSREPDITGKIGKAWNISEAVVNPDENAMLASYVIEYESPDGNTNYYSAGLIHLRVEPGKVMPDKNYDSAAFEFAIYALNPNHEVDVDKADKGDFSGVIALGVPTVLHQFSPALKQVLSDKQAVEVIDEAIKSLLSPEGHRRKHLNPEKDYNENWIRVIQSGIDKRMRKLAFTPE